MNESINVWKFVFFLVPFVFFLFMLSFGAGTVKWKKDELWSACLVIFKDSTEQSVAKNIYIYGMRHGGASRSVNIAQQPSRLLEWKLRVWRLWMKKQAAFVNSCKMVWTNRLRSFEEIERKRGYCERMFVVNWTNGSRNGWGNSAANAFTTLYQHAVWFFRICRSSIHGHQYISLMPEYTMCAFVFRPVQLYIERSLLECRMYICAFLVWQST